MGLKVWGFTVSIAVRAFDIIPAVFEINYYLHDN